MAAAGQKDSPSLGSILHCSLLLLGYKASVYEADISASMFRKANTKGLESLLHFLLTKLRGVSQSKKASLACNMCTVLSQPDLSLTKAIWPLSLQDFKGVWPIKDTRQQKDYRKVCSA